jgi:hypothetical protein
LFFQNAGSSAAIRDFLEQHLVPVLGVPIVHACTVLLSPDTIDDGGHARGGASPGRAALSPVAFAALQDAGAAPVDSPIGSPALAVPVAHGLLLLVCDNVVDASPAAPVLVSLLMALLDHSGVAVSPAARYVEEKVHVFHGFAARLDFFLLEPVCLGLLRLFFVAFLTRQRVR